ncbi:TolB family protein [Paenibacillus sinopodophylli]|uniref:TolB family protein n=1 Tax=Paenibacillus sinopodophylli TaxID=1837342 RepID=UPI00110D0F6D|nr:PD40 domain-containing protein [Paenibacillus sinopodophylli]
MDSNLLFAENEVFETKKGYIITLFLLVTVLVLVGIIFFSMRPQKIQGLSGVIVLSNPDFERNNGKGLLVYDLLTENTRIVGNDKYRHIISANNNRKDVYTVMDRQHVIMDVDLDVFSSFNVLTNAPVGSVHFNKTSVQSGVSFIFNNELQINTSKQILKSITLPYTKNSINKLAGYSWSIDGKTLLYSNSDSIYKYEIEKNQSEKLFKGKYPGFSPDNKYMFYSSDRNTFVVRSLETGTEWTYSGIHSYPQFSPDGKYVAFQIQSKKILAKGRDLIVWEYEAGKKQTIIQDIVLDNSGQFIWIP